MSNKRKRQRGRNQNPYYRNNITSNYNYPIPNYDWDMYNYAGCSGYSAGSSMEYSTGQDNRHGFGQQQFEPISVAQDRYRKFENIFVTAKELHHSEGESEVVQDNMSGDKSEGLGTVKSNGRPNQESNKVEKLLNKMLSTPVDMKKGERCAGERMANFCPRNIVMTKNGTSKGQKLIKESKKKLNWWINLGKKYEEARNLCITALNDIPEYQAMIQKRLQLQKQPTQDNQKQKKKRRKQKVVMNNSDTQDDELSCLYIIKTVGEINEDEAERIGLKIAELISQENEGEGPVFLGNSLRAGCLKIICANNQSREWLTSHFSRMKWEGKVLTIFDEKEILVPTYATTWIPYSNLSDGHILPMLMAQNKNMDFSSWKIENSKLEEEGQSLTFSFNESCINSLLERNFRLNFYLGTIQLGIETSIDHRN